ncbi:MAG TPA: hypothetical protein VGJ59_06755 [Jatrophihabitantaceae bacterium]|jgi:hypothetical protein
MSQLKRLLVGTRETITGTVYGTIVVLASVTAAGRLYLRDLWRLEVIVAATVLVLWLAHVYSDALGESLRVGRRLTAAELGRVASHESAIPLAAVLPMAAVALGALGVIDGGTAVWIALGIGIGTLALEGLSYARLERLSLLATVASVAINLAVGLVIVLLKVLVSH